jgi:hypothetical protein
VFIDPLGVRVVATAVFIDPLGVRRICKKEKEKMGQKLKQVENHIKGTDAVHRSICHFISTVSNGEICLSKMTRKSTADLMKIRLQ